MNFLKAIMLCAAIAARPPAALACEGRNATNIQAFIHFSPEHAIFLGTVMSTTPGWKKFFGWPEASTIRVTRWYSGRHPQKTVTLPHLVPAPIAGQPCPDLVPRFEARTGEQWLIIGSSVGGVIKEHAQYSRRVIPGHRPPDELREVEAMRQSRPRSAR